MVEAWLKQVLRAALVSKALSALKKAPLMSSDIQPQALEQLERTLLERTLQLHLEIKSVMTVALDDGGAGHDITVGIHDGQDVTGCYWMLLVLAVLWP